MRRRHSHRRCCNTDLASNKVTPTNAAVWDSTNIAIDLEWLECLKIFQTAERTARKLGLLALDWTWIVGEIWIHCVDLDGTGFTEFHFWSKRIKIIQHLQISTAHLHRFTGDPRLGWPVQMGIRGAAGGWGLGDVLKQRLPKCSESN